MGGSSRGFSVARYSLYQEIQISMNFPCLIAESEAVAITAVLQQVSEFSCKLFGKAASPSK
jgi:hypothetical protein